MRALLGACSLFILVACAGPGKAGQLAETQPRPADTPTESLPLPMITGFTQIASATIQASPLIPAETPPPSPAPPTDTPSPSRTNISSPTLAPLTAAAIASCPVTMPNGSTPPGERPSPHQHGNGDLWTGIWPGGIVTFSPNGPGEMLPDGSLSMKFFWWRAAPGQPLTIEGRRLDAAAPPLRASIPDGYFGKFQASGLIFASEGCWEVTGRVRDASLTFVTLVIKVAFDPRWPAWLPEGLLIADTDTVDYPPRSVRLVFRFPNGDKGEVSIETIQAAQADRGPYPDGTPQVTVNGWPGWCVQGARDAQGRWQADMDAGTLTLAWAAEDLSYRISHAGLGLRCEDLLRIAGSSP